MIKPVLALTINEISLKQFRACFKEHENYTVCIVQLLNRAIAKAKDSNTLDDDIASMICYTVNDSVDIDEMMDIHDRLYDEACDLIKPWINVFTLMRPRLLLADTKTNELLISLDPHSDARSNLKLNRLQGEFKTIMRSLKQED